MRMLAALDRHLMDARPRPLGGVRRGLLEFLYFGIKEARPASSSPGFSWRSWSRPAPAWLGLYARTEIIFRPMDRDRRMPLLLGFVLTGFFIWLAENIGTFWGVWRYPNQLGAWSFVHLSKWSAWSLLVIMTFTIVASLKHVKATVHIAEK